MYDPSCPPPRTSHMTTPHHTSLPVTLLLAAALMLGTHCSTSTGVIEALVDAGQGGSGGGDPGDEPTGSVVVFSGGQIAGAGPATVVIADGDIAMVLGPADAVDLPGAQVVDISGQWLAPAFIDSHVHIAYTFLSPTSMAQGGVAAVVDHAAPVAAFTQSFAPLRVQLAGPMVTPEGGYPTQSWGQNGYGMEVADAAEAAAAVQLLHELGAGLIKVPLEASGPELTDEQLAAITGTAHDLGLLVTAHALDDAAAMRGAEAGVDVLSHCPVETLSPETLEAWSDRVVISTLGAFGGSQATLANLTALREGGATVLYGTDLGNTNHAGIDPAEIALMQSAGMDGTAILAAGTTTPAAVWGFDDLGSIEAGKAASFLVLGADPLEDPLALTHPNQVWIDGVEM